MESAAIVRLFENGNARNRSLKQSAGVRVKMRKRIILPKNFFFSLFTLLKSNSITLRDLYVIPPRPPRISA